MLTQKTPKKPQKYLCELCDFTCINKKDYNRHLSTQKHKRLTNTNKNSPKNPKAFICSCGKEYKHAPSLTKHKKICTFIETEEDADENIQQLIEKKDDDDVDYKQLLIQSMKQNSELIKQMSEIVPNIGNNNNSNNTTTNNFNLQFFLNNDCKDALNLTDFINSLQVQLKDLEYTANNGHIQGITNIFHTALCNMEETKRPMHCTDLKREVLYIKDNDEWHKDEEKEEIKRAVDKVVNKNLENTSEWLDAHPDHLNTESNDFNDYMKMTENSLGSGEDNEKNKIVKNIIKDVKLEKSQKCV